MEALLKRRSIRSYTSDPVSEDDLKDILTAAMCAPSAGNEQPWHFVVLRDRNTLDEIPKFHPYAQMLTKTNLAVVVCGDEKLEKFKGYWVQDCSAATQNILLAVEDKGLGAVWLGVYPIEDRVEKLRSLLQLPDSVIPLSIIPIGHPAESKPPNNNYDETRIHYNKW